ncbi:MAG: triose-phosphate isomerase [Malacoplasma sp.]|nr:triose-phosphate isomerase [Malacoplasma sp.]
MRQKVLIANWKMSADFISINKFFKNISNFENVKVMVAPSYLGIIPSLGLVGEKNIEVIAQNISLPSLGNHTGSVSWIELKDYGIKTTLIGHPDAKLDFKEKNYQINAKLHKLIKNDIKAVAFIEETRVDLSKENTKENLKLQINQIFDGIDGLDLIDKVYLVYKPTFLGEISTRFDEKFVFDTIKIIREFLRNKFGYHIGNNLPIIYGGEIENDYIEQICKNNDLDGVLIEDERALSHKYITVLYKHLYNGSNLAYTQHYDYKVLIDLPTENERIKDATKTIDFDMYDTTSDTYFGEIKVIEEDI